MKINHAMILAAGLGTRMRPLSLTMPKPLIPVAGKPLIDWCLDWLEQGGIRHVVVNTSYLAEQIERYLDRRSSPEIHISREEPVPLETGGGILKALPIMGDAPFLVMNSDNIYRNGLTHPIQHMLDVWDDTTDYVMLLQPKATAIGWSGNGDFIMNAAGQIRRPQAGEDAPYIFTGVEIIHPRVFVDCPQGPFSLNMLWKRCEGADGWHQRIKAVAFDGTWLNVGDIAGRDAAEAYLQTR
ncbi:MAG: nucleotidyltransferase family protein [Alphaproteobacteria bacterium]|nr:nucleotidyltransferase family protein [Alphaproteobacteria bacterium]